jgi:DNA gyrase subunit A
MVCVYNLEKDTILVVSEKGYGKRSAVEDYRMTNRGGKGVKTLSITDKTGQLVAIINAIDERDLMIVNKSGTAIRTSMADMRVMGRATQGVKLIDIMRRNDEISSVCSVLSEQDEDNVGESIAQDEVSETPKEEVTDIPENDQREDENSDN